MPHTPYRVCTHIGTMIHILLWSLLPCMHLPVMAQQYFSITTYNVENAFDTTHDEGFDDYTFLPDGENHWHRNRFYKKLNGIAQVCAAVDEQRPLDIIGLCEVENDTVLTYLTRHTAMRSLHYKYIMTHSADRRGVDVALVYQPFTFRLLSHECLRAKTSIPTRDILHAHGMTYMGDTLDIYMVHAPSKLGGASGVANRKKVMECILESIDSITNLRPETAIIVMGDFNDEMKRPSQLLHRGFHDIAQQQRPGSYKYRGTWSSIDHIFVRFPKQSRKLESGILAAPFLLEADKTHGGNKPFRTFYGPRYNGGFSDHLPVWVRIWK